MELLQIKTLQRKIAEYPERISKLQARQKLIVTPSATEIGPAIKGMDAYLLFLRAGISSYKSSTKRLPWISRDLIHILKIKKVSEK